jgi:hypothetical protein
MPPLLESVNANMILAIISMPSHLTQGRLLAAGGHVMVG